MTREEALVHNRRCHAKYTVKIGARKDGTFTALQVEAYMDTGAFASYGPAVSMILTETMTGSYRIPNVVVDTYVVYTNSPLSGAMRGFGSPQANFAVESMVDTMAEKLSMDPIKLREKNILKTGDKVFTGVTINETAKSLPVTFLRNNIALK